MMWMQVLSAGGKEAKVHDMSRASWLEEAFWGRVAGVSVFFFF